MSKTYMIIGRLINQRTKFSQVRLLDYSNLKTYWINETQLIHLLGTGNKIVNMDRATTGYDVPNYQLVSNQRRLIVDKKPMTGLAVAIIVKSQHNVDRTVDKQQTQGLLVLRAPNKFEYVPFGSDLTALKNVINIATSSDIQSVVGEYSISYAEQIPVLGTNVLVGIPNLKVISVQR